MNLFYALFFSGLLALNFPVQDPWKEKVDNALLERTLTEPRVDFLVHLEEQADLSDAHLQKGKANKGQYVYARLQETARRSQAPLIAFLQNQEAEFKSFSVVNALYVKGDLALIQQLAAWEEVAFIQNNFPIKAPAVQAATSLDFRTIEWGIKMINADDVWDLGYIGQGVVIGGQDTGYDWEHPALKEKYRGWNGSTANHNYNWHDAIHEINPLNNDPDPDPSDNPCGLDVPYPCDDQNHGTHTMGTMVGSEGENEIGVAPGAKWIACRNMERGWGSPATYIECFEFFLAPTDLNNENPDPNMGPHAIANSWSCPEIEGCNTSNFGLMEAAVNNLKAAGTVVVVSAGNSGSSGCTSISTPAAIFENSFTVGATAQNDSIAGFSSRGPVSVDSSFRTKPNVTAPGVGVRSSIPGPAYATYQGTSMAGPHVAGLVALVISANPELAGEVELIEHLVEQTAVPKFSDQNCGGIAGTAYPNNIYGYGRVDALAAVEEALSILDISGPAVEDIQVVPYPNPFVNLLHFNVFNLPGELQFILFDVKGRQVYQTTWTSFSNYSKVTLENTEKLAAGVYFYQVKSGDQLLEGKVIKR